MHRHPATAIAERRGPADPALNRWARRAGSSAGPFQRSCEPELLVRKRRPQPSRRIEVRSGTFPFTSSTEERKRAQHPEQFGMLEDRQPLAGTSQCADDRDIFPVGTHSLGSGHGTDDWTHWLSSKDSSCRWRAAADVGEHTVVLFY